MDMLPSIAFALLAVTQAGVAGSIPATSTTICLHFQSLANLAFPCAGKKRESKIPVKAVGDTGAPSGGESIETLEIQGIVVSSFGDNGIEEN